MRVGESLGLGRGRQNGDGASTPLWWRGGKHKWGCPLQLPPPPPTSISSLFLPGGRPTEQKPLWRHLIALSLNIISIAAAVLHTVFFLFLYFRLLFISSFIFLYFHLYFFLYTSFFSNSGTFLFLSFLFFLILRGMTICFLSFNFFCCFSLFVFFCFNFYFLMRGKRWKKRFHSCC